MVLYIDKAQDLNGSWLGYSLLKFVVFTDLLEISIIEIVPNSKKKTRQPGIFFFFLKGLSTEKAPKQQRSSTIKEFDFHLNCFLCGSVVSLPSSYNVED